MTNDYKICRKTALIEPRILCVYSGASAIFQKGWQHVTSPLLILCVLPSGVPRFKGDRHICSLCNLVAAISPDRSQYVLLAIAIVVLICGAKVRISALAQAIAGAAFALFVIGSVAVRRTSSTRLPQ